MRPWGRGAVFVPRAVSPSGGFLSRAAPCGLRRFFFRAGRFRRWGGRAFSRGAPEGRARARAILFEGTAARLSPPARPPSQSVWSARPGGPPVTRLSSTPSRCGGWPRRAKTAPTAAAPAPACGLCRAQTPGACPSRLAGARGRQGGEWRMRGGAWPLLSSPPAAVRAGAGGVVREQRGACPPARRETSPPRRSAPAGDPTQAGLAPQSRRLRGRAGLAPPHAAQPKANEAAPLSKRPPPLYTKCPWVSF